MKCGMFPVVKTVAVIFLAVFAAVIPAIGQEEIILKISSNEGGVAKGTLMYQARESNVTSSTVFQNSVEKYTVKAVMPLTQITLVNSTIAPGTKLWRGKAWFLEETKATEKFSAQTWTADINQHRKDVALAAAAVPAQP